VLGIFDLPIVPKVMPAYSVWPCSTADLRYMVLPQRPAGTAGWGEEQLARLVTRDSMIGVCPAADPSTLVD
jgi:nitrile hydratase